MTKRTVASGIVALVAVVAAGFMAPAVLAGGTTHVVTGTVTKVDTATKTIAVKTADGAEMTAAYTSKTSVTAAEGAAKGVKIGTLEGANVAVKYTEVGGKKTALGVTHFAKDDVPQVMEVTATTVAKGGKTVALKTSDGAEETADLSKTAAVQTSKATASGTKTAVVYTMKGGKKLVHMISKP